MTRPIVATFFVVLAITALAGGHGLENPCPERDCSADQEVRVPMGSVVRVSPGDDLGAVVRRVRECRQNGKLSKGGILIELADGVYRLDKALELGAADSGELGSPIVWRAKNRGRVCFSGGVAVTDWRKNGEVWVGTIPGEGTLPGWSTAGCLHKIDSSKLETPISVFENGERLTCARWPKGDAWAQTVAAEVRPGEKGGFVRVDTNAHLAAWAEEADLWAHGMWKFEWADAKCRVLGVDEKARILRVDDEMVKFGFADNVDYCIFNARAELTEPGEWVLDRTVRKISVRPKVDVYAVTIALADRLVRAKDLHDVRFEGIVFEQSRLEAMLFEDCRDVTVDASCFRHTSKFGILASGAKRLRITGCDFFDLGEGAVWIVGGNTETLERGDNVVDNCHIHHFGKVVANYKPGVYMGGSGNSITHNLIHHTDHQAIMFNCTDLYIGWNVIHDTLQHNGDAGAIYCCGQNGRGWTDMRGTLVEHNFIYNSGARPHSRFCLGLYYDDSSSGIHTRWNFINRANTGIYAGGGNQHVVESNLLFSCDNPISQGNRGADTGFNNGAKQGKEGPLWKQLVKRRRNPAWAARFPETERITALADGRFAHWPLFNRWIGNVSVGCGAEVREKDVEKRGNVWEGNRTVGGGTPTLLDTGCVDFLGFNWTLRPDSEAFKALGGDLGFAQAGLYDGERRFSPAVKFGEGIAPNYKPHPDTYQGPGAVAVQIRPVGPNRPCGDQCFAEDLVCCKPIVPPYAYILSSVPVSRAPTAWTEYSFSFTPKYDMDAKLHLVGSWGKDFTAYDDIRATGIELSDDLEEGGQWKQYLEINKPPRNLMPGTGGLVDESTRPFKAAKGHRYALAHLERHFTHPIHLRKGVRVTITFKARAGETPIAD